MGAVIGPLVPLLATACDDDGGGGGGGGTDEALEPELAIKMVNDGYCRCQISVGITTNSGRNDEKSVECCSLLFGLIGLELVWGQNKDRTIELMAMMMGVLTCLQRDLRRQKRAMMAPGSEGCLVCKQRLIFSYLYLTRQSMSS